MILFVKNTSFEKAVKVKHDDTKFLSFCLPQTQQLPPDVSCVP